MSDINNQLQFLAGGGENGALIRAYDWSKTSLGDPEAWPKSLKTCVRIILTSRQPMFVWWGKDLINIYNDAYQAIVGGKHPRALGQPASEVWKEIWDQVGPRAETALKTNEGTYDESLLLIMERNGYPEETYYTFSYSPVPGDDGEPEGIICANTDDTERIISERQLRTLKDLGKAYTGSKSNEDIYAGTIEVLKQNAEDFPFAVLYTALNDHTAALAGSTDVIEQYYPATIDFFKDENNWYLKEAIVDYRETVVDVNGLDLPRGAWPVSPRKVLVLPVMQAGNQQAYGAFVIGLNPYRPLDEKYRSFFGLIADQIATGLTNVRAYEEERKRVEALMEIDNAKTVFFNNVSHEFRTPLTLMLGPVEELMKYQHDSLPAVFKENVSAIDRNAKRLLKLVNSLLEFSRIEAGRVQASYRRADLAGLTQDLSSTFRSIIEKAGLEFNVQLNAIQKPVYIDHEMWEKIVLNLLSNAFKYTLKGSITLLLKEESGYAVLEVTDTGVGIPANELPHMFERFHRVPGSEGRTHEGSGIGLSLIHELVKIHQGDISVISTEGEGSAFTVRIPTGKAHLSPEQVDEEGYVTRVSSVAGAFVNEAESLLLTDDQVNAHHNAASETAYALSDDILTDKGTRILIADDNADMRAYLRRLLEPVFTVHTVINGREALDQIEIFKPHLLLTDVMMPVMNGQELLQNIRSNVSISRLPVIFLSAKAGEDARIEGFEAGADDYLVKPFSAKELLSKIRSQVNLAKARNHADELLKQLFINAPVAICILRGPQLTIELANDLMMELWGRQGQPVNGKNLLDVLPELEGQGFDELMRRVYTTGRRYVSEETRVELIRNGKADAHYIKFIYEPLRETDGTISGVIALAHEVTDLVSARSRAQEIADELRLLVRQKDEFMSIASHELKTPVTSMKAILQILERMNIPDEKLNGFVKKAARQVNRLTALVNDLLDVSTIQAGKIKFYPEKFRFVDMINDVVEQHQQSQSSHVIVNYCHADVYVSADRSRMEQVLNNLLSNAIKYSPGADKIVVDAWLTGERLHVSVKDYGIGIPEEKMGHVFERFYRVEGSGNIFSGMGLGLYISSEIVRRHGGEIGVRKNEEGGSLFWFNLPIEN